MNTALKSAYSLPQCCAGNLDAQTEPKEPAFTGPGFLG